MNDLRFAFRMLRKNAGFTAIAVLTLGAGVGASVSIFSVANAMLLRSLPYEAPARLVSVWQRDKSKEDFWGEVSVPNFVDWKQQAKTFEQLAAFNQESLTLGGSGADAGLPDRVDGGVVTANLFSVLGVKPLLGRVFVPEEEKAGQESVVVLSHAFWQNRLQGNPGALGQSVSLNGERYSIIGVMPKEFHFPPMPEPDQFWIPRVLTPTNLSETNRALRTLYVFGRLRAGASLKSAEAELDAVMKRLGQEHTANRNQGARVRPLKELWHFPFQRIIYVLLGAVGLLVLIACFNVANLLLAKATARQQEIALRAALGASRGQIVRQLLAESAMLSLLGGALGLLLGNWGTKLLAATLPIHNYRVGEIEVDTVVLAFAVAVSLLTALVFGLAPALLVSRVNLYTALKEGGRVGEGNAPHRLRKALVIVQVALAVVLLTGAFFTVESFLTMLRADWGFRFERLMSVHLFLSR